MNWLTTALDSPEFRTLGATSIHIDDHLDDYTEDDAVPTAFRLLDELVTAIHDTDLMAMLVIVTGLHDDIALAAPPAETLEAAWDHWTPPELYLIRRAPLLSPYVVEEYKKPYPPGTFTAPHGVYHAYYRCHRQGDTTEFTSGVYIEHYPGK